MWGDPGIEVSDHALFHITGRKAEVRVLGTRLFDHWITYQFPLPVVRRINMDSIVMVQSQAGEISVSTHAQ